MPQARFSQKNVKIVIFILGLLLLAGAVILSRPGMAAPVSQESGPVAAEYRGVSTAVQFDISPELRSIAPLAAAPNGAEVADRDSGLEGALGPQDIDPLVQTNIGPGEIPAPMVSFNGFANVLGYTPPDPVGDVGPNHYVAMANVHFAVYDKTGTLLYGPAANNTLWAGFGGACQNENAGDPIVIYDQFADRWMLSQFTSAGPTFYNCVALSTTGDPMGSYYRWAFSTGNNFPDYPKYGVWRDAYYISTREFLNGASFAGMGAYALNRAEMLAGDPTPQVISFLATPAVGMYNIGDGLLPADIDGFSLPPLGSPEYFMGSMDNGAGYGAPSDALTLWEFHTDWDTPSNSTFTLVNTLLTAPFDSIFPCSPGSRDCIPQPGTSEKIDILSYRQRPIWRLAYRNFGDHESLVTNQSVEASAAMAGTRWYEVRRPGALAFIYQQGTYSPADGVHRWMGSIAMDANGNMALGYSASNGTATYPSVWYTGRLAGDPLGTLPQGEGVIVNGLGSQTSTGSRWGDYTSMNVDPVDDCTFWYINEWYPVTSVNGWQLRIGAFKYPDCVAAPDLAIIKSGSPNVVLPGAPITYTLQAYNLGPGTIGDLTAVAAITDTSPITIPNSGQATPYPATLDASRLAGVVAKVTVTLRNISHTFPDDIDVLLVAPDGEMSLLMSDAGGGTDIVGVTLTFDDAAATPLPDGTALTTGSYQPTDYTAGDTFAAPAPSGPYSATLTSFIGVDPNGVWSLYVMDDAGGDTGSIADGWTLSLEITPSVVVTDELPAGVTFVGGTAPSWNCVNVGQRVACVLNGPLNPGPAPDITINATARLLPGFMDNWAYISSLMTDPNATNNHDNEITLVDTPPLAVNDYYTVTEDATLTVPAPGVIANDVDPDGVLVANNTSDPANGTLSFDPSGSFVYTPTANFNGLDQFNYTIFDGYLGDDATVYITVTSVNDEPLVDAGGNQSADEGDELSFAGVFTDTGKLSADAGESILWDFGDGGTATGVLTPTHVFADNGLYTVTLTVTDTEGGVGSDYLQVTVSNLAPQMSDPADRSVAVDETFTVTAIITDAGSLDSFTLTIVWAAGVTETVNLPAGSTSFEVTHSYAASGSYTVLVTLTDKDGAAVDLDFVVEVANRNIYLPVIMN